MEAGIVIPTCTVWRPTLEWFKKVNELQGKERSLQMKESFYIPFIFMKVIAVLLMIGLRWITIGDFTRDISMRLKLMPKLMA